MDADLSPAKNQKALQSKHNVLPLDAFPDELYPLIAAHYISPGNITAVGNEFDDINTLQSISHRFRRVLPAAKMSEIWKERCSGHRIKSIMLDLLDIVPQKSKDPHYGLNLKKFVVRDQLAVINSALANLALTHPGRNVYRALRESTYLLGKTDFASKKSLLVSIDDAIVRIDQNAEFIHTTNSTGLTTFERMNLPETVTVAGSLSTEVSYKVLAAAVNEKNELFYCGKRRSQDTYKQINDLFIAKHGELCVPIKFFYNVGQNKYFMHITPTRDDKVVLICVGEGTYVYNIIRFNAKDGSRDTSFGKKGEIYYHILGDKIIGHHNIHESCAAINREGTIFIGNLKNGKLLAKFDADGKVLPIPSASTDSSSSSNDSDGESVSSNDSYGESASDDDNNAVPGGVGEDF